jgi:hypothetical protein
MRRAPFAVGTTTLAAVVAAGCRPEAAAAPDRGALYTDVAALRLVAAPDSAPMTRATGLRVRYTIENARSRAVAVWGAPPCTAVVEVRDVATGAIVFPTGAQNCTGPATALRLVAGAVVRGSFGWLGQDPASSIPAVPAGRFQARLIVQGRTLRDAGDEVRVESAWSAPFTVAP